MNRILIPIFLFLCHGLYGQNKELVVGDNLVWPTGENLVINPGFEEYYNESWGYSWPDSVYSPNDYYSSLDYFNIEHNNPLRQPPSTPFGYQELIPMDVNKAYLGFIPGCFYLDNGISWYAEYIGMTFKKTLDSGDYLIEFDYVLSETWSVWPQSIGCAFDNTATIYLDSFLFEFNYAEAPIVFDTVNWNRFRVLHQASGGEKHLIIGEFNINEVSFSAYSDNYDGKNNGREYVCSYFFIDNVSVRKVEKVLPLTSQVFTLFPNPSPNGQFSLAYNLPGEEPVTFVLYDAIGKRVAEEILPGGVQHVELNFPSLASGAYVWKALQQGGYVGSGKLVIGR